MALTPDELIAISDLEKAQISDSSIVPDWVLPAEVRGSSAPINGIPYPQHTIDVFGGCWLENGRLSSRTRYSALCAIWRYSTGRMRQNRCPRTCQRYN